MKMIIITGASGAIGRALALAYAQAGVTLLLQGRNSQALQETAEACRVAGAEVVTKTLDLLNQQSTLDWVTEVCQQQVPDLFIANAGMNIHAGENSQDEDIHQVGQLVDLNVRCVLQMTNLIAASMRRAGRGQIALISSLAGYYGLPVTPSYSASKAALKAYGEGMRGALAEAGVGVTVVMPGYVDSSMCHEMPGPKPFLWSPERAARVIKKGLDANRARVSFPFPLNLGCWFLSVLPSALSQRILQWLHYA